MEGCKGENEKMRNREEEKERKGIKGKKRWTPKEKEHKREERNMKNN